jgi:hypothetical protein
VWLTCLARAAGLNATPDTAEEELTQLARQRRAVFVLDGLEDLFQKFSSDGREQRALRALLTGCPDWLRSLRGRPLGLVVFVRRDLVLNSIQQNIDQFFARHRAYELRWNQVEALRLAAWVCERAAVLRLAEGEDARTASAALLSRILIQVWGQKLGSDTSREARSEEWFLAALSDFNLQIQARDVVSFLAEATQNALDDEKPRPAGLIGCCRRLLCGGHCRRAAERRYRRYRRRTLRLEISSNACANYRKMFVRFHSRWRLLA